MPIQSILQLLVEYKITIPVKLISSSFYVFESLVIVKENMARNKRGNIHHIQEVDSLQLDAIAQERGVIRFGSTIDPRRRAYQYERQSYSGVMFYTFVYNMKRAEDYLLQYGGRHNVHRKSGARQRPGYVYLIKGRKYS